MQRFLQKLTEGRTAGLEPKDLGPQIKAVDESWARLQKLYNKNEEISKTYNAETSKTEDINVDDDKDLEPLLDDDLDNFTDEELDQLTDKELEDELKELEALMGEMDKEAADQAKTEG